MFAYIFKMHLHTYLYTYICVCVSVYFLCPISSASSSSTWRRDKRTGKSQRHCVDANLSLAQLGSLRLIHILIARMAVEQRINTVYILNSLKYSIYLVYYLSPHYFQWSRESTGFSSILDCLFFFFFNTPRKCNGLSLHLVTDTIN